MNDTPAATSLLVTEEEENGVPALGGTTHLDLESEDYQSPLERLIAHSTSEQRGESVAVSAHHNGSTLGNIATESHPTERRMMTTLWSPTSIVSQTLKPKQPSLVTLAAFVCFFLQMGFCWSSFLSPCWLETRLYLSIALPSVHVEPANSQFLHSTTLGSLLGDLLGADQHWAAVGLVLTAVVLPCLCAVCGVAWIIEDRNEQTMIATKYTSSSRRKQRNWFCPRVVMEYSARIGFSIFFILCILDLGSSPLTIEFNESKFVVVNQMKGGMVSYALGMIFGVSVLALLRFSNANFQSILETTQDSDKNTQNNLGEEAWRKQDFECSWEVHSNELFTGGNFRLANETESGKEAQELETPLLQNGYNLQSPSAGGETSDRHLSERLQTEPGELSFWKRVVLYEISLVSTVLWIPALFLPLFQLRYKGILSDFISEVSLSFRLSDFPAELWDRGIGAGTNPLILYMLDSIFVLLVLACPIVANLAAIGAWTLETEQSRTSSKRLLWILQPFLGTLVFGIALYLTTPAFETVTEAAIEKFSAGICPNFEAVAGEACFAIEAEPTMGLWFLLIQALALELFVVLTLTWHT